MSGARPIHDAPYWCEENVWHLLADPRLTAGPRAAWVLTNARRQVALWGQRAARGPGEPVVWDYHVIAAAHGDDGHWWIWDLDTTFAFPMAVDDYLAATFRARERRLAPRVRVVEGEAYRAGFASDRSHMRDGAGGYQQPLPPWPAIGTGHTLPRLLDVDDARCGPWLELDQLAARYGSSNRP